MTPRRRVMALLFALCLEMLCDILSTRSALAVGAQEANPLARLFLALPDAWLWLCALKALSCGLIIGIVLVVMRVSGERIAAWGLTPALALGCAGMALIDAHNWWLAYTLVAHIAR